MNIFAKNLREIRKKRNMTQAQLANKLGVCPSTVGMYEQGRREPDNETLKKICYMLSVSVDRILGLRMDEKKDLEEIIDEFTQVFKSQQSLMFNGKPIKNEDREKIVNAIRVAAAMAVLDTQK
ncbi:MAG: helix-turn-helix domain-containing protein [Oscillospiraceae bacterium]|jgi:transcriptional regulator with XRE-family HTH domain|nr:helix-turn-helix domain-containing protein [Oscillospiraceae bacterium]